MYLHNCLLIMSLYIAGAVGGVGDSLLPEDKRLSARIREVITHYREQGTVVLPGSDIPDPLSVPDMVKYIGGTPISFKQMKVYGLRNFTVDHINTDVDANQAFVSVYVDRLIITGNHVVRSWLSRVAGEFNLTLLYVEASCATELGRNDDGDLYAVDSSLDMEIGETLVDFKSAGIFGNFLQGLIGSSASAIVEAVKPAILEEFRREMMAGVNDKLKKFGDQLALDRSTTLVERAVQEGRRFVKARGYDPYYIRDYILDNAFFSANISNFQLEGLSDFHKIGGITLFMENGTVNLGMRLAALDLRGRCMWTLDFGKGLIKSGSTNFSVNHFQFRAHVQQSIDVKEHPVLQDLDLNMGKIKVQMEGTGSFDTVISFVASRLPDLIRHIIVDAIEDPVKLKLQEILNNVDVEDVVESGLPHLDQLGL